MKRCLFILFILSFALNHSIAQETGNNLTLPDSLAGKLREFRQNDDSRAKALIDIIEFCLEHQEAEAALPYIKELRDLKYYTEGDYYQIALCDYYFALSICDNNTQEALQWADHSLKALEKAMDNHGTRKLYNRIKLLKSACHYMLNMFPEEYLDLKDGIEIALEEKDSILLGKLFSNLGLMYQNLDCLKEASDALHQSLQYYPSYFPTFLNLAVNYQITQEKDSSYQFNDSVYKYLDYALSTARNKKDTASTFHILGCTKLFNNEYNEAKDYLTKALKDYELSSASLYELSVVRRDLARVESIENNLKNALDIINEAIWLAELGNEENTLEYCYSVKSDIEKKMGDYKTALENLEKGLEIENRLNKLRDKEKIEQLERDLMLKEAKEKLRFEQFKASQKQHTTWIVTGLIVFFSLFITVLLVIFNRKRRRVLELELNAQHREMTSKALNQMRINETLKEVVNQLGQIKEAPENMETGLSSMIRDLNEMVDDGSKKDFDYYFVQVHPDFYNNLKKDFPSLTANDLRLCAFIKAKLSTKEIADLNHMSADSVKNSRSRLRKKLGLTDISTSLDSVISNY